MNRFAKVWILSACVIALGVACGGDDDDGSTAGTGAGNGSGGSSGEAGESGTTGGSSDTGGTGDTGGSGGSGGSGGGGGSGGSTAAEPVVCGGTTCAAPSNSRLTACCIDDGDECGEKIRGGFIMSTCSAPVEPHPECESLMRMGFTLPSCCNEQGQCGVQQPLINFPCTSYEELAAIAADAGLGGDGGTADGGTAIMAPEPKSCTP